METISSLVSELDLASPRVLDVGCGDGYLITALAARHRFRDSVAQDIHLTDAMAESLATPTVRFVKHLEQPSASPFDLILLLDLLEHVEDPVAFLRDQISPLASNRTRFLITVPAFQSLYTEHDRKLGHYRRYDRSAAIAMVRSAGLHVLDSGYLFSSLLVPRALSMAVERVRRPPASSAPTGVGAWSAPAPLTRLLHRALCLDNRLCLSARRLGVVLPGLSVWLSCTKPL